MNCPKCGAKMLADRSDTMIVNACPKCLYSECYISEANVDKMFDRVFNQMKEEKDEVKP